MQPFDLEIARREPERIVAPVAGVARVVDGAVMLEADCGERYCYGPSEFKFLSLKD